MNFLSLVGFVLCSSGLCEKVVTRFEEPYTCVCVCVWSSNLNKQSPYLSISLQHHRKKVT